MINANPSCGTGEGITVPCCPNPIPTTLIATITVGDACSCMNGEQIELNYNGSQWVGSKSLCGTTIEIRFYCEEGKGWLYDFIGCDSDAFGSQPESEVCDPLEVVFVSTFLPNCCGTGVTETFTVKITH